uniref:Hydrolase n=1 Tax=candidate division WOR-3 bacterium TaxID=2052148 RepID=A0A7V3ZVQ4_UNCW3
MIFFIFLFLINSSAKIIKAIYIDKPPIIDGKIDIIWQKGDSAKDFIQRYPNEGKIPSESTTVYLLFDNEALYVAFKAYMKDIRKLKKTVSEREHCYGDRVGFIIDTFKDNQNAYYFAINLGNVQFDGKFYEGGNSFDYNWDGIWYSAVKIYSWGYFAEFKVPFKTIRYKEDLSEWNINFERIINYNDESNWWVAQKKDIFRIAQSGRLVGVKPGKKGFYLEIFPFSLIKREEKKISLKGGLDIDWKITSEVSLTTTLFPDFAQIEADPYQINISKYEIFVPEKRPFFIEGNEIYSLSSQIFTLPYTRKIGKAMPSGRIVPINLGAKIILQEKNFDFSFLSIFTDSLENELKSLYKIGRFKSKILKNSSLGIGYYSKENFRMENEAFNVDGNFNFDYFNPIFYLGKTKKNDKNGEYLIFINNFYYKNLNVSNLFFHLSPEFDISEIGYFQESGIGNTNSFYYGFYNLPFLRAFCIGNYLNLFKDWKWEKGIAYSFAPFLSFTFENQMSTSFNFHLFKNYENNLWYNSYGCFLYLSSPYHKKFKSNLLFSYYKKVYNYRKYYFAPYGSINLYLAYDLLPNLKLSFTCDNLLEYDSLERLNFKKDVSNSFIFFLNYSLTNNIHFRINNQLIRYLPEGKEKVEIGNNLSFLFTYNFLPKSSVYFAFTLPLFNPLPGKISAFVFKIKYLIFL